MPSEHRSIGDASLFVHEQGDGSPILLIHGFPLDHTMWRGQFDKLARNHRVIAPDLRGFGRSSASCETATMEAFADDLNALLDVMNAERRVVICGLSMGGYVAFQFWRKYGDRVRGLILCDTRAVADDEQAQRGRLAMADTVLTHGAGVAAEAMMPKLFAAGTVERSPEIVEQLRETILKTDPEAIAAAQRGMAERPNVENLLPEIDSPSLVLVGEHDAISPVDEMRRIAEAMPECEFAVIPGVGHMAPLEDPDAVNERLTEFLQTLS